MPQGYWNREPGDDRGVVSHDLELAAAGEVLPLAPDHHYVFLWGDAAAGAGIITSTPVLPDGRLL